MSSGDGTPRNHPTRIQQISEALIASGYTSLDEQARALGIHRSTAWTIIKTKHKLGRLSAKTTSRILANPDTPPMVRVVVQRYLAERSDATASGDYRRRSAQVSTTRPYAKDFLDLAELKNLPSRIV